MDISGLLRCMVVLFVTIGIGYLAAKLGLIDTDFNKKLTKLVLNVTLPLLTLSSVLGTEHVLSNFEVLILTLLAVGCYAFLLAASLLVSRLLRVDGREAGLYRFMFIFSNIGFIGYPVVQALMGDGAIFYQSIFVMFYNIIVFPLGAWLFGGGQEKFRFSWKIFRTPAVIASLAAYALYLTGWRAPALLTELVSYTGNLTSPLSLLIIGASLSTIPLGSVFRNVRLYLLMLLKMIATPLLAYAVLHPFLHNEIMLAIVVVVLSMPIGSYSTMFALEYQGDEKLASSGVFVSTLLSILTIPAIMWLLFCR